MICAIHKQTYAGQRAYRYHVSDESGNVRYVAEPAGLLLPTPICLVEIFDPDRRLVGCLKPLDAALWRGEKRYQFLLSEGSEVGTEEPYAIIQERSRLVDVLLLRLPRYELQLGEHRYVAEGSRYGGRFYELFCVLEEAPQGVDGGDAESESGTELDSERAPRPEVMRVGQIHRPAAGPSYVVETDAVPLRQALAVLAALVVLIDLELTG